MLPNNIIFLDRDRREGRSFRVHQSNTSELSNIFFYLTYVVINQVIKIMLNTIHCVSLRFSCESFDLSFPLLWVSKCAIDHHELYFLFTKVLHFIRFRFHVA